MHYSDKQHERKHKILVVDDEAMVLQLLRRFLNNLGFEVTTVTDGSSAITEYKNALHKKNKFFAVIIDLSLEGELSGLETTEKLRELDSDLRAVVSSGYADEPVLSDYQHYGFSGALPKPFTIDDLNRVLSK